MARYGTFIYGDGEVYSGTATFPIDEPGLARVPWIFQDVASDDVYEFAVNPLDATVPSIQKNISTQYTASGQPINFEGRQSVGKISFSGTILHEAHLNAMNEWAAKSTQVNLSDDLGRKYWVVITSFSPTRQYVPQYPWRHEYSAEATVLSWN